VIISSARRALLVCLTVCASVLGTTAAAAAHPRPLPEGPAGPPGRLPDGRIARPPRLPAGRTASRCRRAAYGPKFYAPGSGKTVALTFDDGPGKSTWSILQILRKYRVPATFFNLGMNAAARPHLLRHELAREMDEMSAEQQRITGTRPCVFRPPFGAYNRTTLRLAQERRMRVWLWSVDTEDWKAEGSGAARWVDRIIRLAEDEGIRLRNPVVLMHNQPIGNPATVSALPTIIRFFQRHHYHFVKL
jgi:peptidoglycan/xylan/chitin deacetylase (PgdA/CDA1 family)